MQDTSVKVTERFIAVFDFVRLLGQIRHDSCSPKQMGVARKRVTRPYDGPSAPPVVEAEEFDLTSELMDLECAIKEKARHEWNIAPDAAHLMALMQAR